MKGKDTCCEPLSSARKKRQYESAKVEIYTFGTADVIRTSVNVGVRDDITNDTFGKDFSNWD